MIYSGEEGAVELRERGSSGIDVASGGAGPGPSVEVGSTSWGLIEVNTLPALTPSTVLFQQLLENGIAKTPTGVLKHIIC